MKITLRSCPIIWVQYFRSWFVFSSTIFMWYLQEQVAFKVKLSKGTKGEFPAELPQVITWSWNVAALNSPSILFKESKTKTFCQNLHTWHTLHTIVQNPSQFLHARTMTTLKIDLIPAHTLRTKWLAPKTFSQNTHTSHTLHTKIQN